MPVLRACKDGLGGDLQLNRRAKIKLNSEASRTRLIIANLTVFLQAALTPQP